LFQFDLNGWFRPFSGPSKHWATSVD